MNALFPEIETTTEAVPHDAPPPMPEMWLVLACMKGCVWTCPSTFGATLWFSREAAQEAAKKLAGVWIHKRLVRIPGEEAK